MGMLFVFILLIVVVLGILYPVLKGLFAVQDHYERKQDTAQFNNSLNASQSVSVDTVQQRAKQYLANNETIDRVFTGVGLSAVVITSKRILSFSINNLYGTPTIANLKDIVRVTTNNEIKGNYNNAGSIPSGIQTERREGYSTIVLFLSNGNVAIHNISNNSTNTIVDAINKAVANNL